VIPSSTAVADAVPWYRTITADQWRVLLAAKFGWMLDAMDFMLYAMAVGELRAYFGFDDGTAGLLGTATLVMSGIGGLLFGYVADRFGRTRALMATIAIFSLASLGAATSMTVLQLLLWRALLGIGMGSFDGKDPVGQFRNRGRHERNPRGARIYQAGGRDEVRRLLPRARRLPIGESRIGTGDVRDSGFTGRA
jgi:hypothetical protein